MSDKVPVPVSGGDAGKGKPDGVNVSKARTAGGESGGGAYQNPHTGKDGAGGFGGFFGHGGQTEIAYHGGDQAGAEGSETFNATTKGDRLDDVEDAGPKPGPTGPHQDLSPEYSREVELNGRHVVIVDTSGVAAAEADGRTGRNEDPNADDHPGSG